MIEICRKYTDEEIVKSFIEDVEAVKEQLPQNEPCQCMDFPDTFEQFAKDYGFKDVEERYTNGSELIPIFRVNQWLEHIKPSEDAVSRKAVLDVVNNPLNIRLDDIIKKLPSVTPVISEKDAAAFCDHYCRFPHEYDEELNGVPLAESHICLSCPINGRGSEENADTK